MTDNLADSSESENENINELLHEAIGTDLATGLDTLADATADLMFDRTKRLMEAVIEYKELMMMYSCAMKEIRTKFEVLNTEFNTRYQRNPISSINTRLKRTSSITEKLARQDLPFTIRNIEDHIHDVAGVRIICSYIDDIYTIAEALLRQDDIILTGRKDYIANPKPNGYRSLHLIVKVPVFFAAQRKELYAEVQIRTIAMDFWASLEHKIYYKFEGQAPDGIREELRECAKIISYLDQKMLSINEYVQHYHDDFNDTGSTMSAADIRHMDYTKERNNANHIPDKIKSLFGKIMNE